MINLPEWIQAFCACSTFALAIIVAIQQTKIKTLTEVVESLNNQTEVSQQLLQFEIKTRLKEIQPWFIRASHQWNLNHFEMSFQNIGQRARHLQFKAVENIESISVHNPDNLAIITDETISGVYNPKEKNNPFVFEIIYQDNHGDYFSQTVKGKNGTSLRISPPEKLDAP